MRFRRGYVRLIYGVLGMSALVGCGGDGGSASVSGGTATIQGSVPGTVFIAVDNDTNLEVGRGTATGTPKSFSLDIPTGDSYRFYVMVNEGTGNSRVYPMYMGASNVFALDNSADGQVISLGVVSADLMTGRSTPAESPVLMMARGANDMIPPTLAGGAFSMDSVKGTSWAYNTLMTSGTMVWEYGTLSFDTDGMGRMSGIFRNGSPVPPRENISYAMSLSGMLLDPGDDTFQCVVSRDMSLMVATFTDGTGGPGMRIAQKRGGTFQPDGSDMTGTWRFQRLTAGSDNTTSGWAYGTMQFTSGSATITSMTTNAGLGGGNFVYSMDVDGIMTEIGNDSFHGVMSMDKTMIAATDTNGGNPVLWLLMKTTGIPYSLTDMTGDWVMHAISSGNPGSRGWAYGQSVADANGNETFFGMTGSSGPVSSTQMSFSMNAGVMTMGGTGGMMGGGMMGGGMSTSTFHGIMNEAKNIMVSTYSDGNGGYPFSIQMK